MGISTGGVTALYHANYTGGGFIVPSLSQVNTNFGSAALNANDAYFSPISFPITFLCSNLQFYVQGVPTAGNIKAGIYSSDSNGNPGTLIFSSADLAIATGGIKTISLGNLPISAFSKYWVGLHCSVTSITVSCCQGHPINSGAASPLIGVNGGGTQDSLYINTPYANGLPSVYSGYTASFASKILLALQMV